MITVGSGEKLLEQCERLGQHGASLKMLRASLLLNRAWYSTACSLKWKMQNTKCKHSIFQLAPSVLPIVANGFGWLPTPNASVANDGEKPETWLARAAKLKVKHGNGNGAGMPLSIAVQMLPTPTTRDYRSVTGNEPAQRDNAMQNLNVAIGVNPGGGKTGYKLHRDFAAYMMGFPIDWLDLD